MELVLSSSCLFILFSLPLFTFSEALPASLSQEAISLLDFKTSISQDPSNLLSNWNASIHDNHCYWYGVECDPLSGTVTALRITAGSRIAGFLSPSIGNLSALRTLSLPHNLFSGEIPSEIGQMRALQTLELQGNNLSGRIPPQITNISSLSLLNLSCNILSGPLPDGLVGFGSVATVDLSNNQLSGPIGLPSCEFLNHLRLSNNFFVGNIPADLGKCSKLRTLLLDGNIFEGPISAEIGQATELRILDVSRNSLTDRIPRELANCKELSVVVLTNTVTDLGSDQNSSPFVDFPGAGGEFNAFQGGIPYDVLSLPKLQIFWAPRANLGGQLPSSWTNFCSLRVLNLGQNYFAGILPKTVSMCKNLTFLDLSSNNFQGLLPSQLQVSCMVFFNASHNLFTGLLPRFSNSSCNINTISYGEGPSFLDEEDVHIAYVNIPPFWGSHANNAFVSNSDAYHLSVQHDFSWNRFFGSLPLFSFRNKLYFTNGANVSYTLLLNNNEINGSLPEALFSDCNHLQNFAINLSSNQIYGSLFPELFLNCFQLTNFEAAQNRIGGSIPPEIGSLKMLQLLDLGNNMLSGPLPEKLGDLKYLKWIYLKQNNLTGYISSQLGRLTSLKVLDLSQNALSGPIPGSLGYATCLEVVLLAHNRLSGVIPTSFSTLADLTTLDLSFNNLSGHIPHLQRANNCDYFRGNIFLSRCPDPYSPPPTGLPVPFEVKPGSSRRKLKLFVIAMATSASLVFFVLLVIVLVLIIGRRKFSRVTSLRRKVVVTLSDAPTEWNYDDVVRATGNFSIRNLIGTGGFGSTYKAELVPGFLVAVKRLAMGRFQGIQQFDAEIRTLGRIRHKNLVTLVGYYVGEDEMILIYNYLSGGNLETFIHKRSGKNVEWPVIHKIAYDIAQALSFLHYSCVPRIVHRDIKPSNILLDEGLNAFLSDFGLARLLEVSETHATTDVAGTFGYVAPEYATTCRVSNKADVYSFGVVLLELMSGKKSLDPSFSEYGNGFNIVAWARMLIEEGRPSELFSSELWESGPRDNLLGMLRLASTCTMESLSVRPSMKHVLEKLKQLKS